MTTCVHNLLGGQRWVDHYGEVTLINHANGIKCKLTFTKVSINHISLEKLCYHFIFVFKRNTPLVVQNLFDKLIMFKGVNVIGFHVHVLDLDEHEFLCILEPYACCTN